MHSLQGDLPVLPPERLVLDGRVVRHDDGGHPAAGGRHQEGARGQDQRRPEEGQHEDRLMIMT